MIALCTATKKALLGVSINGKEACEELDANCKHSENVMLTIDKMLDEIDENIIDNDCFSVVIGPGSFTGLRIAVALVKGLIAGGGEKKIISITTSQLMAYSYIIEKKPKNQFFTVINALSGKYYICGFSPDGKVIEEDKVVEEEELNNLGTVKVGLEEEAIKNMDCYVNLHAQELLALSKEKLLKNEVINPQQLIPLYIRKSQAEEEK